MFGSKKEKNDKPKAPSTSSTVPSPKPSRAASQRPAASTLIARDVLIKGDIIGESEVRIEGKVEGNVNVKSGIVLGEKAQVMGNLTSDSITVFGQLKGNLTAKDLVIKSTAHLTGDFFVETLEIEPGGKYNGTLKMDYQSNQKPKLITPESVKEIKGA